jgi:protein NrfD
VTRAGLGLFLLEAAAGTAFLLLFFPPKTLGKGFFSLHGAIAFTLAVLAALAKPTGLSTGVVVVSGALLGAYSLAAHAGRAGAARPLLLAGAAAAAFGASRVALLAPLTPGSGWTVASAAVGGLFFGAVLLTMNLGHWYLVSRSLPFQLLARGATLFAALAAARAVLLGTAIAVNPRPEGLEALLSLDRDALFFLFRVVWGVLGPLALSYFVWRTAEMKSNQAATGLLYVALVFVLIGELLSSYLTIATGFPA